MLGELLVADPEAIEATRLCHFLLVVDHGRLVVNDRVFFMHDRSLVVGHEGGLMQ